MIKIAMKLRVFVEPFTLMEKADGLYKKLSFLIGPKYRPTRFI